MADPANYGNHDRDIQQDETTLVWFSHKKERAIKLASITRIVPGQRTAVFRRYLRPEKDYLSFSLIYNNGERSLDLLTECTSNCFKTNCNIDTSTSCNTKPTSPYSRKPSPPRTATPVFSKSIIDSLTRTNELQNQDLQKLQAQLTDIAEKLPPEFRDGLGVMHGQAETFLKHSEHSAIEGGAQNSSKLVVPDNRESTSQHSIDNGLKSPPSSRQSTDGEAELVEQFEPDSSSKDENRAW
ncbi:hypothetical protein C4D60_Mb06t37320 [Musa balbisiana]|uniref:Uncharacterized protein n=1 Tax=Musa balbisiana TaxID=52838 RepID=A0A4S8IVY9_MUSBA|nr:hypothetical protein C4D60_Mb06t37320 [Musa balbisiana]